MAWPFALAGRPVKASSSVQVSVVAASESFATLSVTVSPVSVPSAKRRKVTLAGRTPATLEASFQTLATLRLTVSGACVLVIVPPSAAGAPVAS